MRVDELPGRARLPLEDSVRLRLDELGDEQIRRAEVEAVAQLAVSAEGRPDLAESVRVCDLRLPRRLDPRAHLGDVAAGLAARDQRAEAERRRVEALGPRPLRQVVRVGGDREHPVGS